MLITKATTPQHDQQRVEDFYFKRTANTTVFEDCEREPPRDKMDRWQIVPPSGPLRTTAPASGKEDECS